MYRILNKLMIKFNFKAEITKKKLSSKHSVPRKSHNLSYSIFYLSIEKEIADQLKYNDVTDTFTDRTKITSINR